MAKTLELLKAVLQSSFDLEVKQLCDDYLHMFQLAAHNIRENTGGDVPISTLKMLVCSMLDEVRRGVVCSMPDEVRRGVVCGMLDEVRKGVVCSMLDEVRRGGRRV